MNKKKLIIFGGSFDPVHKGHIKIANRAFKKIKADKLFFVPCNNHPLNKTISASNQERLDMLKLAIKGYPRFEICDFELKRNEVSYTIDTINYFEKYYNDYEIYLLIGFDQLVNFKKWYKFEQILQKAIIICHRRFMLDKKVLLTREEIFANKKDSQDDNSINDNDHLDLQNNTYLTTKIDINHLKDLQESNQQFSYIKHILIGGFKINISSSEIRNNPKKSHLNPLVLKYINDNGLYAISRLEKVMSDYRKEHSIRVATIATDIAKSLKYYPLIKPAYVAAIYHDYAKELDKKYQESFWTLLKIGYLFKYKKQYNLLKKENKHNDFWKVIHAWLGAYLVKHKFFINDYQVINAIKNHTILETTDNLLAKIIFCADKLDVRKDGEIQDRKQLYELCKKDINKGYKEILKRLKGE